MHNLEECNRLGQVKKDTLKKVQNMEPAKHERHSSLPSLRGDTSLAPLALSTEKRKPGRPRKTEADKIAKAHKVLAKVAEDTIALGTIAIANPEFDGGGTLESSPTITKDSLQRRVSRRLNVLDRYLTDERLLSLMDQSSLKEIGIYEGIMMDKSLVLQGQPTVIVGTKERAEIDEVLPRLMNELHRRKLITTLRERSVEFKDSTLGI